MLLQIKHLRKDYPRNGKLFSAVNNVNLNVAEGEFVTIMGKSGSGKTTLLNMIAGLLTPTSGQVTLAGTNLFGLTDKDVSAFRNQHIGYIPQGSSLLSNLTALENIRLPFYFTPRQGSSLALANELMEQAGVGYLSHTYPAEMSGGEMRRIAIIRALLCSPKLLVADEPTSDLDEESAQMIMTMLTTINQQGTTLLLVTHDRTVAEYSQRVINMAGGQLE